MENASRSVIDIIRSQFDISTLSNVCLYVDYTRNGAIALAVARMLLILGVPNVLGISSKQSHYANLEEKHFNFQAELAINNGFRWLPNNSTTSSISFDLVILGLTTTATDLKLDIPSTRNVISIGGVPFDSTSIHIDLILPTTLSIKHSTLFIIDIGISSRIIKKYLQKTNLLTTSGSIDHLFSNSSFIQLVE